MPKKDLAGELSVPSCLFSFLSIPFAGEREKNGRLTDQLETAWVFLGYSMSCYCRFSSNNRVTPSKSSDGQSSMTSKAKGKENREQKLVCLSCRLPRSQSFCSTTLLTCERKRRVHEDKSILDHVLFPQVKAHASLGHTCSISICLVLLFIC